MKKSEELDNFVAKVERLDFIRKYSPLCTNFEAFDVNGVMLLGGCNIATDNWQYNIFLSWLDDMSEAVKEVRFWVYNPYDETDSFVTAVTFIKRW